MSDKSAAELEREAEATRARVVATAESIRGKMTPGQLFDEFTGIFSGGAGSDMLHNLKTQVRDNPLPLTVIGAGLAWLMLGSGASAATPAPGYATRSGSDGHDGTSTAGTGAMTSDTYASVGDMASGAAGTVSGMASSAAGTMSDMASSVSGMASGAAETLTNSATATADMATRATRSAQQLMEEQPLAVAAVGLAIGAAIGAMLPHTQLEDERLGGYREQLRERAEDALEKGVDQVKQVAAEAYQAASDEAGRQASSEGTLADKVSDVVKSAADKADEAVHRRLSDTEPSTTNKS
ncbi:DUF3618 domain-containing protein [Mesorhizobium sp. WSM3868]|uniref:DUF3618 domain-containing protein n=1 Tax=Mesorhizobium sp. WSM3868 TaxID=2029405 RepID=UPI000BAE6B4E|nr:DUF3618 domain-containing protein [Mesorhizobium sp. WSM3868]PBB33135.1 hypothetical protein CK221_24105 [Mesorhizobium sp. WSM3868]